MLVRDVRVQRGTPRDVPTVVPCGRGKQRPALGYIGLAVFSVLIECRVQ